MGGFFNLVGETKNKLSFFILLSSLDLNRSGHDARMHRKISSLFLKKKTGLSLLLFWRHHLLHKSSDICHLNFLRCFVSAVCFDYFIVRVERFTLRFLKILLLSRNISSILIFISRRKKNIWKCLLTIQWHTMRFDVTWGINREWISL